DLERFFRTRPTAGERRVQSAGMRRRGMICLAVVMALVSVLVTRAGADGGAAAYSTSDISVGSNQSGAMQLFTVGDNGDVRTNWQVAPSSGFNGWAPLGGPNGPAIASNVA